MSESRNTLLAALTIGALQGLLSQHDGELHGDGTGSFSPCWNVGLSHHIARIAKLAVEIAARTELELELYSAEQDRREAEIAEGGAK